MSSRRGFVGGRGLSPCVEEPNACEPLLLGSEDDRRSGRNQGVAVPIAASPELHPVEFVMISSRVRPRPGPRATRFHQRLAAPMF